MERESRGSAPSIEHVLAMVPSSKCLAIFHPISLRPLATDLGTRVGNWGCLDGAMAPSLLRYESGKM